MPEAKVNCPRCGSEILLTTAQRGGGVCAPCQKFHAPADISDTEADTAAASLQSRARVLGVSTRVIPLEEWQQLPSELSEHVPLWLKNLLARHALYGIGLEHRILADKQTHVFSFQSPDDFGSFFDEGSTNFDLLQAGYVPIGYESNGNLWIVEQAAGPKGRVYLFELGDWGGGSLSRESGLVLSADRLARLMTGMGVFEIVLY
jgi:hypothetical protein